jgi:predicted RNA methylase
MLKYAARLRAGDGVSDYEFDAVFEPEVQKISFRHWTPVAVASRAAHLLTDIGVTRILDVGAGPGKFCIVGASATTAHFTGIEQRRNLVEAARSAAFRFGADRTRFVHANIVDFDWGPFDGFYLYNPFQEQIDGDLLPIDQTLHRSPALYKAYVASTVAKLNRAPVGTAVVTYNGFGGTMPPQYRQVHREDLGGAALVLWLRTGYSKTLPRKVPAEQASLGGPGQDGPLETCPRSG